MRAVALCAVALCPTATLANDEVAPGEASFAERPVEEPGLVDEDEDYAPRRQEYAFNPVQARNELRVGIFYTKKGSHKAAAGRFLEATRWDSNLAEAYWRLGMAWEKLGQPIKAIEAYARFMEIETDSKKSRQVGKRLGRLRGAIRDLPLSAGDSPAEALP